MSEDLAMDSQVVQAAEAGLPEAWREHVRELRSENARRRKENQELRTQLTALSDQVREAEGAQTAAAERSQQAAARLAAVHRRLKEAEAARLAREALRAAARRRTAGAQGGRGEDTVGQADRGTQAAGARADQAGPTDRTDRSDPTDQMNRARAAQDAAPPLTAEGATAGLSSRALAPIGTAGQADRGTSGPALVDLGRALRLLERIPLPVDVEADLSVDDEGRVGLAPEAGERLTRFVEELVDLVAVETRVAPPPVGGEPPRTAEGGPGPIVNAWDPEGQVSPAGKARASLRQTAAANAVVLDGLTQL